MPDAARSTVVVSRSTGVLADGRDSVSITVTVRKADGVTLADSTVTLEVSGDGNTLTPASGKTNAEGVMTATLMSTRPGSKQVTASVATDGAPVVLSSRPTVEFVALQPARLAFTTTSIQATAGAPLSPVVEVVLQDSAGATVRGATLPVTVSLATAPPSATLEGTLTVNAVDGVARFTDLNIKKAGTGYSLRATAGSLPPATSATFEVVPAAASVLELTGLPASMTAGGTIGASVVLKDAFGNVATGYRGTLRFSSSDPTAVLPPDATFTAADAGQKSFTGVRLHTAGTRSITVQDTGNATLTDTENVTVNPGALAELRLAAPAGATAGSTFSVTVSAVDAFANVVSNYTGTVHFSTDDTQATLPGDYTFTLADAGSRMFNITLATAGMQPVRVEEGTRDATATVTVAPAGATRLALTGLASPAPAGVPDFVAVTAYDAFNNVATGYRGTVHFTSTDAQAQLAPDYTFTAGDMGMADLFVELRTAGNQTVTVTDTANAALTATAAAVVEPGSPKQLVFTQQPANSTVRTTLAEVRVALRDDYGNATNATSPMVTVSLTGGNAAATLSGTKSVNPAGGVASFANLSIDQEGTGFMLTASAQDLSGATSTAFNIVDNVAPATAIITVTPSSATSATVAWQAVGDDGNLGTASEYDLRYATSPINSEADFAAATRVSIPVPRAPGSGESATVSGLDLSTAHHFALKVLDGAGNFSRSASVRVGGDLCSGVVCTPPATTCSPDGTSVVSYTSACQQNTGMCQDTPSTTRCQAFETCNAGACVPVTAGSQAGAIIISEFSALGSEFIELHNTTGSSIDVAGYTLRNAAGMTVDIRAVNDPNGTAATPVTIPAGGYLHGVANPSGAIPAGVGFVYGAPGTTFALTDTGDALALYTVAPAGSLQDAVDFRSFVTNPNTPLVASNFVGFAGNSTQLEPTVLTAAGNDTAINWCVSFYAAGGRGSRIANTAGAMNGSCKVAVINEAFIDAIGADDGKTFIEIAGPGGSVIGGAKLTDIEGKTGNTTNPEGSPNTAEVVIPQGVRIPADGILLIVDKVGATNNTAVPNFVPGVDVRAPVNMTLEDGGGDSIQLISGANSPTLLDALGHDVSGPTLDTNVATNNFAMYEMATALFQASVGNAAVSLSRSPDSRDTDNNRNDFRADPTQTPGLPNDTVNFTVTGMTPTEVPHPVNSTTITVTGTDFGPAMSMQLGSGTAEDCTVASPTQATCTALARATPARVNVVFANKPAMGVPDVTLINGFTYTGSLNGTTDPMQADFCNIQSPHSFAIQAGQMTSVIYGRIYEAGLTEAGGAPAGVIAQVGYGPSGSNPTSTNTWRFFSATYNVQAGNDDEFQGSFVAPSVAASTTYSYAYRFSRDNGVRWTYCDRNGAGSNAGLSFETTQLGTMTVNP